MLAFTGVVCSRILKNSENWRKSENLRFQGPDSDLQTPQYVENAEWTAKNTRPDEVATLTRFF